MHRDVHAPLSTRYHFYLSHRNAGLDTGWGSDEAGMQEARPNAHYIDENDTHGRRRTPDDSDFDADFELLPVCQLRELFNISSSMQVEPMLCICVLNVLKTANK